MFVMNKAAVEVVSFGLQGYSHETDSDVMLIHFVKVSVLVPQTRGVVATQGWPCVEFSTQ